MTRVYTVVVPSLDFDVEYKRARNEATDAVLKLMIELREDALTVTRNDCGQANYRHVAAMRTITQQAKLALEALQRARR